MEPEPQPARARQRQRARLALPGAGAHRAAASLSPARPAPPHPFTPRPAPRADRRRPPSQVRIKYMRKCAPIKETVWTNIPSVKHRKPGGPLHYELWLGKSQAHELLKLFYTRG